MRKFFTLVFLPMLAACGEAPTTAEGCPIYATPIMQAQTAACQQAYYTEKARLNGGTVTRCFGASDTMTCVSD